MRLLSSRSRPAIGALFSATNRSVTATTITTTTTTTTTAQSSLLTSAAANSLKRHHHHYHHFVTPTPTTRRYLHATSIAHHGYAASEVDEKTAVAVTFVDRDGKERAVKAPPGKSLLEIAHANDIDLEGACEGSLACSTCHVYLDQKTFDAVEEPCDDENDMLDLAFGLTELLGCQIKASKEVDGMKATLPPATRNMAVDGYVPQPH